MTDAHREGKIRALGVSNFPADRFIDFASHVQIAPADNQVEANVFNQDTGKSFIIVSHESHFDI